MTGEASEADFSREKAADAAFFEDWSEFERLDGLPNRPSKGGLPVRWGNVGLRDYSEYYAILRRSVACVGGPAFEIRAPENRPICDVIRRLPGACQDPRINGRDRVAYRRYQNLWFVPAEHWQAVRHMLPQLRAMITDWSLRR
jgi:hypothetical protein